MFCEKCGKEVDEKWSVCPNCGAQTGGNSSRQTMAGMSAPVESPKKKAKKPIFKRVWFWILIVILGIFIVLLMAGSGEDTSDSGTTRGTVNDNNTLLNLDVTVINNTGIDIYELYASTVDVDNWEEDILGENILYAGESFVIKFTYFPDQTKWDFAMADSTGQLIEFYGLDFEDCDPSGATLTLEYDGENGYATLE